MYVTWEDDAGRALAMKSVGDALAKSEPIVRTHGTDIFLDVAPNNVSVRDGFGRGDYDTFRGEDRLPTKPKDVIRACMRSYKKVGIVRNVIDLMGDFATQGIDLNHPNERIEAWYKEWFRRVGGKERSERFVNLFYRTGNVVVKRQTAKLSVKQEDAMRRSQAAPDIQIPPEAILEKREVPWRYTYLNPLTLEVMADELAIFVGSEDFVYGVRVPKTLARKIKEPKTDNERRLVSRLPKDVLQAILNEEEFVQLDQDKVRGFYYKRDDWEAWASPMVEAILADLQVLDKMKLADLAALDGAISCIRVWKLGSAEAKIMPTEVAIARLAEMLTNNVGGGVMDLVWDFAIELEETSTDVHQFLGSTKYEPVLTSIYAGLGIPPTMTGAATSGGFTNNFISLKTLTERLQYGRDTLAAFWDSEIRLVQKAMGFRFPATLTFDRMTLSDESAEKALLIQLADRDLISWESVVERFGESPEIEQVRMRREMRRRDNGQLPEKASPYHKPFKEHELKNTFASQGVVTPSQVGVELEPNEEGQKTFVQQQNDQTNKSARVALKGQQAQNDHQFRTEKLQLKHGAHPNQQEKAPGQPGQGRPKNAKDSQKRKQKVVKPRTSAKLFQTMAWAENAQAQLEQLAKPALLKALGHKTLRDLTDEQALAFERYKFIALCRLSPNTVIDSTTMVELSKAELSLPGPVDALIRETIAQHARANGKEPTLEVLRRYQAGAYAMWKANLEDGDE